MGRLIPHILVQNRYLYDDQQWAAIERSLEPKLAEYGAKSIYIPKLLKSDLKVVLDGRLPWAEAVKSSESDRQSGGRIDLASPKQNDLSA